MQRGWRYAVCAVLAGAATCCFGADWPMWRCDPARRAISDDTVPKKFRLQWVQHLPPLKPAFWQIRQQRLQFDLGYEPVVAANTMFVGSSRNDCLTALDVATGKVKWQFYADGPIRFAPVFWDGKIYFGADDGIVRCLDAGDGSLHWQFRAVPSPRKCLGNGRLISVWPVRGGPVIADGKLFLRRESGHSRVSLSTR